MKVRIVSLESVELESNKGHSVLFPAGTLFVTTEVDDPELVAVARPTDAIYFAHPTRHVLGAVDGYEDSVDPWYFFITEHERLSFVQATKEWAASVAAMIRKTPRDLVIPPSVLSSIGYMTDTRKAFTFDRCFIQSMVRCAQSYDGHRSKVCMVLANAEGVSHSFDTFTPLPFLSPEEIHGPLNLI